MFFEIRYERGRLANLLDATSRSSKERKARTRHALPGCIFGVNSLPPCLSRANAALRACASRKRLKRSTGRA